MAELHDLAEWSDQLVKKVQGIWRELYPLIGTKKEFFRWDIDSKSLVLQNTQTLAAF